MISKNKEEIKKIKEETISTMLIENKEIPEKWTNKKSFLKILKKALRNEDIRNIYVKNMDDNIQKAKYNEKLKQNLPKIMEKYRNKSAYEVDNDLMTLINNRKNIINPVKKFMNINEEFNYIIKQQNMKIESPKPDSIKENLKNILEYRRQIASRFNYNKFCNNGKNLIKKSRSQIMKSNHNSQFYTINTNNDKSLNKVYNLKSYNHFSNKNIRNNYVIKEKIKKEYEDKFMITGMNNKKFKDNYIIEEEKTNPKEKIEYFRNNNIKKSQSGVY
jgi:hypothetical protein